MRAGLVIALFMFGCAAQKPAQTKTAANGPLYSSPGQAKPKGTLRCHMEQETGSNRMERVCRYEDKKGLGDSSVDDAMIKMEQRAAQHVIPGQ